jgi:hypothetical protein
VSDDDAGTTRAPPARPLSGERRQADGETDLHRDLMTDLIFALKWFLRSTRAYVAGNLFIYYEEGNPRAAVAPDVFVALGVGAAAAAHLSDVARGGARAGRGDRDHVEEDAQR